IDQGRSRFDATMVARRKISTLRSRDRKGRQTRAVAIVDLANGRWRFVFVHRSAKRREQPGLVAGGKDNCVYERDESGGSGKAGKEKEEGRRIKESGECNLPNRFAGGVKKSGNEISIEQERFQQDCEKNKR